MATTKQVQEKLQALGWPIRNDGDYGPATHEAVTDFQRGFTPWDLLIDGYAGPQTVGALDVSLYYGGHASPHFRFAEFKSKGNGWIKVHRDLIRGLERMRAVTGPLDIVNGYRDLRYNQQVGGAKNSQHLYGNASDIPGHLNVSQVRQLKAFSGIGYNERSGLVVHVDVRHVGPNTTAASIGNPTVWKYPR